MLLGPLAQASAGIGLVDLAAKENNDPLIFEGMRSFHLSMVMARGVFQQAWPSAHAHIDVATCKSTGAPGRLIVHHLQESRAVLVGLLEPYGLLPGKKEDLEIFEGKLVTGGEDLLREALADRHSDAYLRMAQRQIAEFAALAMAPLASVEMGRMLGEMLSPRLPTNIAELFVDAFSEAILGNTRPMRPPSTGHL